MNQILTKMLECFFPPHCVFCDCVLSSGQIICKHCSETVSETFWQRDFLLLSKYSFSCTALYDYTSEVRSALIRFKFQDETILKEYFGEKLSERMRKISFKPDIVTSVPISKKRKRRRGYNQSELLARELSKNLEVPYQELLFKVRDNVPQHELSEQDRLENVKDVYCTKNDEEILGKKILLVDDILTTGATMCSAGQTLFCAGAKDVFGIAVATTPVSR